MANIDDEILYNNGNYAFRAWIDPYNAEDIDDDEYPTVFDIIRYVPNDLYGKISEYKLSPMIDTVSRFYYKEPNVYYYIEEEVFNMKVIPEVVATYNYNDDTDILYIDKNFIKNCNSIGEFMRFVECTNFGHTYLADEYENNWLEHSKCTKFTEIAKVGDFILRKNDNILYTDVYEIVTIRDNEDYQKMDGWEKYGDTDLYINYCDGRCMPKSYFETPKLPYVLATIRKTVNSFEITSKDNSFSNICTNHRITLDVISILKKSVEYFERLYNTKR